jgi:hypothetical protein
MSVKLKTHGLKSTGKTAKGSIYLAGQVAKQHLHLQPRFTTFIHGPAYLPRMLPGTICPETRSHTAPGLDSQTLSAARHTGRLRQRV